MAWERKAAVLLLLHRTQRHAEDGGLGKLLLTA